MQYPKMIVLGLLAQGMKYGLEMEDYIARSNMRLWAKIGGSTIYKTLNDLKADGCVDVRLTPAKRGPGKKVFKLTKLGKERFAQVVEETMRSEESVYSDRITGLVFALSLPKPIALKNIMRTINGLEGALRVIRQEKYKRKSSASAKIVLDFYEKVYTAEQDACKAALAHLNNSTDTIDD